MPELIEIRSWLPEHNRGQRSATFDGLALPGQVGVTLASSAGRILCLAPAEWLVISEGKSSPDILRQDLPELLDQGLVVTEVTDGFAVLTVRGPTARDVLSKGCGLDFEPRAFPAGRCARTRLAQTLVIVDCVDDAPGFDLYVPRSYRQFLSDWLDDAAAEFTSSPL